MGNPESNTSGKIYTRTGDMGLTALTTGERVSKSDFRVRLGGEVDELNSLVGLAASLTGDQEPAALFHRIQNQLMGIAGRLQTPSRVTVEAEILEAMEREIDSLTDSMEPISYFILPGGSPAAAACHVARTVCRRVERNLVALGEKEPLSGTVFQYFNRLSDLLFVLARHLNFREGVPDIRWRK